MRILLGVCLTGVVGLWAWALLWHKPVQALPPDYVGEFVLDRELYLPPKGDDSNPYPLGQKRHFYFFADGRYKMRIMVNAGYEMWRQEGQVEERDGLLILTQVSVNRSEKRDGPWRYAPSWGRDKDGDYLRLHEVDLDYTIYLRRVG
jgi:hypothetical protein